MRAMAGAGSSSYTSRQRQVIQQLLAAAEGFQASPREEKALLEAGRVESNYTHLTGGDRDSTGVLQQRPSQGWGPVGESVKADALQFLQAARKARGVQGSAGALAQAVQRSAFPGRYDEHASEADALRGGGSSGGSVSGGSSDPGAAARTGVPDAASSAGVQALMAALGGQQQPRPSAGLQAPSFAAQAALPGGYSAPMSAGGPAPRSAGVDALLAASAVSQDAGLVDHSGGATDTAGAAGSSSASSAGAASGRVVVDAGANRAGASLTPGIERVARIIAGVHGAPIHIGTGTAHSRMTTSGNVSDHWEGNAFDSPATGKQLTSMATDALLATAQGKTVQWLRNDGSVGSVKVTAQNAQQLAASGGIFNVPYGKARRIQVIANTQQGGDHTNHLHVGVTPLRGH